MIFNNNILQYNFKQLHIFFTRLHLIARKFIIKFKDSITRTLEKYKKLNSLEKIFKI